MSTCTHIQLKGAGQRYGYRWILRDVDILLEHTDVTLFYGPNGSGKTTLLKTILGIRPPAEGYVAYLGESKQAAHEKAAPVPATTSEDIDRKTFLRNAVYIGHDGGSYMDMTGQENLDFWCRIYGLGRNDRRQRIEEALAKADLKSKLPVRFFSRGMRQRLNLARIFLFEDSAPPAWIFLDEPLTGLDKAGRILLTDLLTQRREAGLGAVVVTHEPDYFKSVESARINFKDGTCHSQEGP